MKVLQPHQEDAVCNVLQRYAARERVAGQCLVGGTGAGKTLCSIECLWRIAQSSPRALAALIVVPSVGGNVPEQWMRELEEQGLGGTSVLYTGAERAKLLQMWRKMDRRAGEVHAVVTTIHTLLADCRRAQEEEHASSPASLCHAATSAFERLGPLDLFVVDEFQDFRNGSSIMRPHEEVDGAKRLYVTLDALFRTCRPSFTIGLSATPMVNTYCDVYSFVRLWCALPKHAWTYRTGGSKEHQAASRAQRRLFVDDMVVTIAPLPTPVPEATSRVVSHALTRDEVALVTELSAILHRRIRDYLRKLATAYAVKTADAHRAADDAHRHVLAATTRYRRALLFPGFAAPSDAPALPRRQRAERHARATPLEACSKMHAIVRRIRELPATQRVLVQFSFADPCEVLRAYLEAEVPERLILVHHGDVHMPKAMRAFTGTPGAVLLATRGSVGRAVSIDATTPGDGGRRLPVHQIFADVASSQADQEQAEGRTRRPLAQGWPGDDDRVLEWTVDHVRADCILDGGTRVPTLEDAMLEMVRTKGARAASLMSAEEAREAKLDMSSDEPDKGILASIADALAWATHACAPRAGRGRKRRLPDEPTP